MELLIIFHMKILIRAFLKLLQNLSDAKQDLKNRWPHVIYVKNTGQTIIRYQEYDWLDVTDLREALGYLILIITAFDMPPNRPVLFYVLESCFFGYKVPKLGTSGVLVRGRIGQLCEEEGKPVLFL